LKVILNVVIEAMILLREGFHHRDTETQRLHREEEEESPYLSIHRRDAENTETAQRVRNNLCATSVLLGVSVVNL